MDWMEEWRRVEGWPYEVSNLGDVRRIGPKGGRLKPYPTRKGHFSVVLNDAPRKRSFLVHQLVCAAFHGPKPTPKHEVCHWDRNPANNCAMNLRWGLPKDNSDDRLRHGTRTRGERMNTARLTERQVLEIRATLAEKRASMYALAKRYSVSETAIANIAKRRTWGWLPDSPTP